jgi:hypothetical protein
MVLFLKMFHHIFYVSCNSYNRFGSYSSRKLKSPHRMSFMKLFSEATSFFQILSFQSYWSIVLLLLTALAQLLTLSWSISEGIIIMTHRRV